MFVVGVLMRSWPHCQTQTISARLAKWVVLFFISLQGSPRMCILGFCVQNSHLRKPFFTRRYASFYNRFPAFHTKHAATGCTFKVKPGQSLTIQGLAFGSQARPWDAWVKNVFGAPCGVRHCRSWGPKRVTLNTLTDWATTQPNFRGKSEDFNC